ncbi:hypothetical protein PR048_020796 [Dryococelus australis]|uniref:Transposase n=1 Tax=Dryococelus australis TaxID=614101 RepID=A0ABQ9GWH6_9NEOP|nr:hypothetical protein PR048_020796 [Dryococelus australis]
MDARLSDHTGPFFFLQFTQMVIAQFKLLLELTRPHLLKWSHRKPLSSEEKLAMILKYLAQGGSPQSVAWEFCVGKSTFSEVLVEVCTVL